MNVECAKEHIRQIDNICEEANTYFSTHMDEAGFLIDAVAFLVDYRRTLERAIDKAELKL